MTNFSILEVSAVAFENAQEIEGGAAEKYRVSLPDLGTVILKLDEESLNGAWVEKITYELAKLIDLPAATYEFAQLFDGRRAIISGDYLQSNYNEQSGKSLLNQCFGQGNYSYTIDTILTTAELNQIDLPLKYTFPPQVKTAADLIAGYLVFDYWIDNIDRHYENWGIQIDTTTGRKELLPTYDHGLGLGYLLFEEEYLDLDPANHVQNQSSAFSGSKGRSLSMNGMLATVVSIKPDAVKVWMERITQIDSQIVTQLFDRIPAGWISEPAKNFAIELLEFNRQQIASICELALPEIPEMENPPNSPEPPPDSPEPPNPRNPPNSPKPSTPPNSPDSTNSPDPPDPPDSIDSSQPMATSINIENSGIAAPNIDSQQLTDLQQKRQIMTDLEGFHGNAQNQVSANAGDISKLAEQLGEALGLIGSESGAKAVKEFFKAYGKIMQALKKEQEQADLKLNNSIIAKSLADRKVSLKESKQNLLEQTREFRRDSRKYAIKAGLDYIVSLCTNVKKFLKDVWDTPGKFFRGVKNKFTSLKDFMLQETKGAVKIGQELTGNKQEQAAKFIELLNTPAGKQAPQGLENTIIAPWGENLITVDAENNVTTNLIQPLMTNELVQLAMDKNVVAAAMAPNINPVPNSLVSQEIDLHEKLIGQDAIDHFLANIQATQLSKSTIKELEDLLSEPSQVKLEALLDSIEQPLMSVSVEAEIPLMVDVEGVIPDPFNQPETQPLVITKTQLEDLSDDRHDDLKNVVYTSLDKNDEFGSRLEKMQAAADKFITTDEYAALEQFETTNLQALVQKLESNITAEEVNIPEFTKYLAENPNSLPQDQETDLKSIQVRTEKLADAKALLTFIEAKYPAKSTANALEQPKYTLIDLSLSELIVKRDAEIDRAVIPHNSALTAQTREQNLDRVLANPEYAEIQSSAIETVLIAIWTNTERLEHNRGENLERIERKNIALTEAQKLADREEIEDPNRKDKIKDLTQEIDKLTKFDQYHNQELATLIQLKEYIQHPELKPVARLTAAPQISQSPKPLVTDVAAVNELSFKDDVQPSTLPQPDFVAIAVTPKLAIDLVTIAQLHQIGTLSDTSSLPLLQSAEDKAPLLITQTATESGSAIYQIVDTEKEFRFTVTPEQIVTNFQIRQDNNSTQIRQLVTSIANVVNAPAQTDLRPRANADLQRIETVQQLNGLLNQTATQPNRATRSVVTLGNERFGMKIDAETQRVVITDKTTLETVAFGKDGIKDGGLLKKMTEVAKDKSSSLAQRLVRVVVEKTNEAKTVLGNATPNIMAGLDERATADRATAQKANKAVNRLGAQVDSLIGQGIRSVVAANPGMLGTVRRMKKIEQVGDANENQVKDDLQSAGEHLGDAPLSSEPLSDTPSAENRRLLTADEREQLQREFDAVVVHKPKAQTSGQAMQPTH